jgi:stress-induced morphogen
MRPFDSKKTEETRKIEEFLRQHFHDVESYRQNSASIRLRIVDDSFRGLSRVEREQRVFPLLDQLPPDTLSDITIVLMLTPEELSESLANFDFERPMASLL